METFEHVRKAVWLDFSSLISGPHNDFSNFLNIFLYNVKSWFKFLLLLFIIPTVNNFTVIIRITAIMMHYLLSYELLEVYHTISRNLWNKLEQS